MVARSTVSFALLASSIRRVTVPASGDLETTIPWIPAEVTTRSFFFSSSSNFCNACCFAFIVLCCGKITMSQNRISARTIKLSGFAISIHQPGVSVVGFEVVSAAGTGVTVSTWAISPKPRYKNSSSPNKAKTSIPNRSVHEPAPSQYRVGAKRVEIGRLSSLSHRKPNREVYFWALRVTSPQSDYLYASFCSRPPLSRHIRQDPGGLLGLSRLIRHPSSTVPIHLTRRATYDAALFRPEGSVQPMPGLRSPGSDILWQPSPGGATQRTLYRPFGARDSEITAFRWLRHRHRLFRAFGPKEMCNFRRKCATSKSVKPVAWRPKPQESQAFALRAINETICSGRIWDNGTRGRLYLSQKPRNLNENGSATPKSSRTA